MKGVRPCAAAGACEGGKIRSFVTVQYPHSYEVFSKYLSYYTNYTKKEA